MNRFLASLEVTFRRDPTNFRPRINKFDSLKDKEQKSRNAYLSVITSLSARTSLSSSSPR